MHLLPPFRLLPRLLPRTAPGCHAWRHRMPLKQAGRRGHGL
jgi:hypothetical protein